VNPDIQLFFDQLRDRAAVNPDLNALSPEELALPSVRLVTQRVPYARIEIGGSRIGGVPDVPHDFEWPRWLPLKQRDDRFGRPWPMTRSTPLGFIAQIDLSEIPNVDEILPSSGWLYFFYDRYCEPWGFDPADRGCCRVIYSKCDRSELVRTEAPSDADSEHVAQPCALQVWPELTLPDHMPELEYGTSAFDAYQALCNDLCNGGGDTKHRLLGHPQLIQNPMELECQLASNGVYCGGASHFQEEEVQALEAGSMDWRLLLQIDTDEDGPGWMWGDCGRIYFWIKEQDLAALRFDDVWLILQCC
jgi:uncharacterized protein YwqG